MVKKLKNIKVLVWDVDGTLYQTPAEFYNQLHQFWVGEVKKKLGLSFEKAEKIYDQYKKKYLSSTLTLKVLGIGEEKEILVKSEEIVKGKKFIKKDPKLVGLFRKLKNFRHLVLRNGTRRETIARLELLGLIEREKRGKYLSTERSDRFYPCLEYSGGLGSFERVFGTVDAFDTVKPDEKVFKKILEYTKLPADQHLMIGDRVEVDLMPAKKLGMRTCLVWSESDNKNVDVSIKRIYDIINLLAC